MKNVLLAPMIGITLLAIPLHQSRAATDDAIVRLEHAWLAAARQHDRPALKHILADDFIDTDIHGRTRDKSATVTHRGAPPGTTQTLQHLKIRRYDDMAIATGTNVVHSKAQGWTARIAFTDVFTRRQGRWRAVSAQETLVHTAPPRSQTRH